MLCALQVRILQYQLQAVHTMHALPLVLPPPYAPPYTNAWALPHSGGLHWAPAPLPMLHPPTSQGVPAGVAASAQQSCSPAVTGATEAAAPSQQFFSAAASPQGSTTGASMAAAAERGPDGDLIPAFREAQPAGSPAAAALHSHQPQEGQPGKLQEAGVGKQQPQGAAPQQPELAAAALPTASASPGLPATVGPPAPGAPELAATPPTAMQVPPLAAAATAAAAGPSAGVTAAEEDIDGLIAAAERAVSVLSGRSHPGSEDSAVEAWLAEAVAAANLPALSSAAGAAEAAADPQPKVAGAAAAPSGRSWSLPSTSRHTARSAASGTSTVLGVVRVKVPSFLDYGGLGAGGRKGPGGLRARGLADS